jgi:hypothetical protein
LRAIHVVDDSKRAGKVFGMVKVDGAPIVPVRLDEAAERIVTEVREQLAKTDTELDLDADLLIGSRSDAVANRAKGPVW